MKGLTKKEMAALDEAMIRIGIDVPRMMELAGLFTALVAADLIRHDKKKKILVMGGPGNNGGDGLVAARHLLNWGYRTDVAFATAVKRLKPVPMQQWKILKNMRIRPVKKIRWRDYGLIIDALLGYNASENPRKGFAEMITAANSSKVPILAVDLPSGLDASGKAWNPCIEAKATIALSAMKKGLLHSRRHTGKVLVSYMTVPDEISRKFGLGRFSEKRLIAGASRPFS